MHAKNEFYCVSASRVYFNPSEALAAGFKTLPFFELSPAEVLAVAERAFKLQISELKEITLSICDVLPAWKDLCRDISPLVGVTTSSFLDAVDSGIHKAAVFESDGLFIAIYGTDETWVVHSRPQAEEIFEFFRALLTLSKQNAEMLGWSKNFAPYFAGSK